MVTVFETTRTSTHIFFVKPCIYKHEGEAWEVEYRSLNPKTGEPWQSSKAVTDGATIEPEGWKGRPIAYPTIDVARQAVERQKAKFEKRGIGRTGVA